MGVGQWKQQDLSDRWQVDRIFEPQMSADQREAACAGWDAAVRTVTGKA
jgi:glycerol kinase